MPKIPTPENQGPQRLNTQTTQPANTPYQRFDVPVMDDTGRALQRLGAAGIQLAGMLKQKQDEAGTLRGQERRDQFLVEAYNPETGIFSALGGNARGVTADWQERVRQAEAEALQGLSGDAQNAVRQLFSGLEVRITQAAAGHELRQLDQALTDTFNGAIEAQMAVIAGDPMNDEAFQTALVEIEAAASHVADQRGMGLGGEDDKSREVFLQTYRTSAIVTRSTALAMTNPEAALAFLERNQDMMGPTEYAEAHGRLMPIVQRRRARQAAMEAGTLDSTAMAPGQVLAPAPNTRIVYSGSVERPPNDIVINTLSQRVEEFFGPGATIVVTSGYRSPRNDTAAARHRTGFASDQKIRLQDGSYVRTDSPEFQEFWSYLFHDTRSFAGGGFGYEGMGAHAFDVGTAEAYALGQGPQTTAQREAIARGEFAFHGAATALRLDTAQGGPTRRAAAQQRSGTFTTIDVVVDAIFGAESTNNDFATNSASTAAGAGQFIRGTWMEFIRARHPDMIGQMSEQEILNLRFDRQYMREATTWYATENSARLQRAGLPTSAANIYLMHFAGPAGGLNILRAAPGTLVRDVMTRAQIDANRGVRHNGVTIANMTVEQLQQWAAAKMSEHGAARAQAGGEGAAQQPPVGPEQLVPARTGMDYINSITDPDERFMALEEYAGMLRSQNTIRASEQQGAIDNLYADIEGDRQRGELRDLDEYLTPEILQLLGDRIPEVRQFHALDVSSDPDYVLDLQMAMENPQGREQIANMDETALRRARARLDDTDFQWLLNSRRALLEARTETGRVPPPGEFMPSYSDIISEVTFELESVTPDGHLDTEQGRVDLNRAVRATQELMSRAADRLGGELGPQDRARIMRRIGEEFGFGDDTNDIFSAIGELDASEYVTSEDLLTKIVSEDEPFIIGGAVIEPDYARALHHILMEDPARGGLPMSAEDFALELWYLMDVPADVREDALRPYLQIVAAEDDEDAARFPLGRPSSASSEFNDTLLDNMDMSQ